MVGDLVGDVMGGSTNGHSVDVRAPAGPADPRPLSVLDRLARSLHVAGGGLEATLEAIVSNAVRTVHGTDDAGLILVRRRALVPVTTTGERPARLDECQRVARSGPCFDAAAHQDTVLVTDLTRDDRYPHLHDLAVELGVRAMVCVPLEVDDRVTGALSLYSSNAGAYDTVDLEWASLYATLAALALADAQRLAQLEEALAGRDVLGQAKGVLMERLRLGPDEAFARLAAASQATNTKLSVVADHLVRTGELLEPGRRPRP